ncbi:MAG: AbrB/MazE/SpoVT family DNA-binding domain-containing protein [Beijerinckiaceae bacterium]
MKSATSKVSARAQTVLPKLVREQLKVIPGDMVRFVIEDGRVTIERHQPTAEDPFVAFDEWSSAADDKAYGSL